MDHRDHIVLRLARLRIDQAGAAAGYFGAEEHALRSALFDGRGKKVWIVGTGVEKEIVTEILLRFFFLIAGHAESDGDAGHLAALTDLELGKGAVRIHSGARSLDHHAPERAS